jgi:hypothetical protein
VFKNSPMNSDIIFGTGTSQSIANVKSLNNADIKRIEMSPGRYEAHQDARQQYLLIITL